MLTSSLFPEQETQVPPVPGLALQQEWIAAEAESRLLAIIDEHPWSNELKRRVQHYGWQYDYRARAVHPEMYLGPLPAWAQPLANRLQAEGYFQEAPDQLIVNEYQPGQGIALHTDCEPCFTSTVVSLSLAAPVAMEVAPKTSPRQKQSFELPRRSLLMLRDTARYHWLHGIPARKTDPAAEGRRPRERRVSLTFRRVDRSNL
jgi:alkylated DNA repair dioxygenase AlkB